MAVERRQKILQMFEVVGVYCGGLESRRMKVLTKDDRLEEFNMNSGEHTLEVHFRAKAICTKSLEGLLTVRLE